MISGLKSLNISGIECLPIVEGGKGIGVSNFATAGAFASCGCVGTISAVNPDIIDENGEIVKQTIKAKNRFERHIEMLENAIKGTVSQIKRARDTVGKNGIIHINALWEMGGTEHLLNEVLSKVKGMLNGVVCGAGMPYKLSEIASKYKTYYYPIVSSMRAFKILWARSFSKAKEWLGGVVYECPWKAGGHNGLTNAEDPFIPQDPYLRIVELRKFMNSVGLEETPIIIAGGVWNLEEFKNYLDNSEVGKVAFQFGTRPMVTQESPISDYWKHLFLNAKKEDVIRNHFSPTGFWSSALNTELMKELFERSKREVEYKEEADEIFNTKIIYKQKEYFIKPENKDSVDAWVRAGNSEILKTPSNTIIFVSEEKAKEIREDLKDCIGCLSCCQFSSWCQYNPDKNYNTGIIPDPRKYCIQKALQYAHKGIENAKALFFAGSNVYRFSEDPFYKDGFIPTIKQLVDRILIGK